ncbi:Fur family transcriptional regulator [Flammeovirga sp. SJP92]|uniref:Fur family transcriptional regulator n=1 Tax=Flammeovirga sp. SJP92 TaxID=1775430 RepID=UPI000788E57B|nr:transcriptional repressor [Flammeovirga sp. SJP92]KXX71838.1 Fur family transcriptional regulator [Flammeovirga sp. SJP92]
MRKAEDILALKGVKPTAVRLNLLEFLLEQDKALSLKEMEIGLLHMDRSSIFRSLKSFEEYKLIHSINDGTGMTKYAVCAEGCNCELEDLHYHFYCTSCEKTFCLMDHPIPSIILPKNFKMTDANMVIKGLCDQCNK